MSLEQNEDKIEGKIINVDIEKEMRKSFIEYSMSVIVSRALPDVRDGLKPVHRRILYSQFEDNLYPDKAYRKCANTVGNVLGRYHPHGDASVYDALVRLAQDFSMRYVLVDGHGNFGSIDGDPPAAYRYTESRMSKISVEMLTDIEKETVDFAPNYDDTRKEPTVLPSRFPNILVNGSTGIAVGMATNIPPHNLGETIDAICLLIDNPDASLEQIMECIKGPDFPTGGIIMGRSGIKSAYATGKGKIYIRAKAEIVEEKNNKFKIVVTELPYQVNKARLIENIAQMVKDKKLEGISHIEDHSDRQGMHIEISIKKDASPKVVLNNLFNYTQMQITFGAILLAIVNGEPKILTLKEILKHYIDFQVDIIKRRTIFDLKKAEERVHILDGLKTAIDFINEVIEIIRSSRDSSDAKYNLCERFNLDDIQAQAIVDMRLRQLSGLERFKIEEEISEINSKIIEYKEILSNNKKLLGIIKDEITVIKNKYSDERKTQIMQISGEVDVEDLIPNDICVLTLTKFGYVKRQKNDTYRTQKRGGRGVSGMSRREEDIASEMFLINSHDYVMFLTNIGKIYRLKCFEIPEGSRTSKGINITNLLPLSGEEKVTSMIRLPQNDVMKFLVMITRKGIIKRTTMEAFSNIRKNGVIAINLEDDDELAWIRLTSGNDDLLVATKKGKAIRFNENDIRPSGRSSRGIKAITLEDDDCVIGMSRLREDCRILTVSETGYGRLSELSDYKVQSRGGKGLINYHTEKYGDVAAIKAVDMVDDIIIIAEDGVIIRIEASSIRVCNRTSKGVLVMKINKNENKIVTVARAPHQENKPGDEQSDENSELDNNDTIPENEIKGVIE